MVSVFDESDYTFEDFLQEFGYNGEMYVSYDEFLENEYQDDEYIHHLLGTGNSELIELYDNERSI